MRFQAIAPTRPAKAIVSVTLPVATMPLATVAATFREMNAPAKFSTDAIAIALRGDRARVEIDEATTFAVSWKPFVKSKASAVPITITSRRVLCIAGRSCQATRSSGRSCGGLRHGTFHELAMSAAGPARAPRPAPLAVERPGEGVVGQAALERVLDLGPELGLTHRRQQLHA